MVLTKKQQANLNLAILVYLKDNHYDEAYAIFKESCDLDDSENTQQPRLLEKKWTSVVRLQRKVLLLEQENKSLMELKTKFDMHHEPGSTNVDALPQLPVRHTLTGHRSAITCVRFHQTQTILATTGDDGSIRLWDYETGKYERTLKGHVDAVQDLCFSPNGQLLASCSADLSIRLWDMDSYQCIKTLNGHDHNVSSLSFFPTGDKLCSSSRDQTIKIWDTNTGYCVLTLRGHEKWIRCVCVSPDGTMIASSSMDKTIRLWLISTGKCERILLGHTHVVESIAFSNSQTDAIIRDRDKDESKNKFLSGTPTEEEAGGKYLVSASRDNQLRVWDVTTGDCIHVLIGHENWVRSVLFHPGGTFIISSSDDKSIRCWNLQKNGKCTHVLDDAHELFVTTIDWNPLTSLLASGGVDNAVKIWECR
uniref:Lissencephaly-1 homolog n=1 Tax=Hirondellea gigas TaxID=1518452 RepID=A0A2P2I1D0_9CRUS